MAQTKDGATKIAAAKAGVSVAEYSRRVSNGSKWCCSCRMWHKQSAFGNDRSRWDGLASSCTESRNAKSRAAYKPKKRPPNGRSFVPARDGDKRQARRRINYFVEAGIIPAPNNLPCVDCGHLWKIGKRRHEYDHYLGYAAEHHEYVEVVCLKCHRERHKNDKN